MKDKFKRYFVGNTARIFSAEWIGRGVIPLFRFVPCNTANSHGFYWLGLKVTWRVPYFEAWQWDEEQSRWVLT